MSQQSLELTCIQTKVLLVDFTYTITHFVLNFVTKKKMSVLTRFPMKHSNGVFQYSVASFRPSWNSKINK